HATEQLIELGGVALPILQSELRKPLPSLEVRRRMERVVEQLPVQVLERRRAREQHAVEVLERMATPNAKKALEALAAGAAAAPLTREARAALDRLAPAAAAP